MKDNDDAVMTCLGLILAIAALVVVGTVVSGWALAKIWNWFIPPIFGLTTLTLWKAMGVSMVFELFTGTNRISKGSKENKDRSAGEVFVSSIVEVVATPLLSVFVAYVILQFAF